MARQQLRAAAAYYEPIFGSVLCGRPEQYRLSKRPGAAEFHSRGIVLYTSPITSP